MHNGANTLTDNMVHDNTIWPMSIYGGSAVDSFTITARDAFVDPGVGLDVITVVGNETNVNGTVTDLADTVEVSTASIQINGGAGIRFVNAESVKLDTKGGDDRIRYLSLPAGTTAMSIEGGAGTDFLDLSRLSATGVIAAPTTLGVEHIDLSHNGIASLSNAFTFLSGTADDAVLTLDLRYNAIDLDDLDALNYFESANNMSSLSQLLLYGNRAASPDPGAPDPEPDLIKLKGRLLRVDLAPVGLAKAEASGNLSAITKALHYLPLEIFEYVLNNYEYQVYAGRMKNPLAVIQTRGERLGPVELLNRASEE